MKLNSLGNQCQGVRPLDHYVDIAVNGPDDGYADLNPERHTSEAVVYFAGEGGSLFLKGDGELGKGGCLRPIQPAGDKHAASFQLRRQNIAAGGIRIFYTEISKHKSLIIRDADVPDENWVPVPVDDLKSVGECGIFVPFARVEKRCRRVSVTHYEFRLLAGDVKLSRKPYDCCSRRCRCRPSAQCTNPITQAADVLFGTHRWNSVSGEQNEGKKAGENAARKCQNSLREFPSTPHGGLHSTAGGSL